MRQISTETLIADVKDAAMQANFELGETEETKQHLDHDEILDVHEVLFEDALSMILSSGSVLPTSLGRSANDDPRPRFNPFKRRRTKE